MRAGFFFLNSFFHFPRLCSVLSASIEFVFTLPVQITNGGSNSELIFEQGEKFETFALIQLKENLNFNSIRTTTTAGCLGEAFLLFPRLEILSFSQSQSPNSSIRQVTVSQSICCVASRHITNKYVHKFHIVYCSHNRNFITIFSICCVLDTVKLMRKCSCIDTKRPEQWRVERYFRFQSIVRSLNDVTRSRERESLEFSLLKFNFNIVELFCRECNEKKMKIVDKSKIIAC